VNVARFLLMFGAAPHVPAICRSGERDANPADATDPRLPEAPRPRRKSKRRQIESGPCATCGGRIPIGSDFVCASCHAVAPDVAAKVARHMLPALEYDAREGDNRAKQAKKLAAEAKKAARKTVKLTAKERRQLRADARRGDQPAGEVRAFLEGQARAS
jgi:hypothetical protein